MLRMNEAEYNRILATAKVENGRYILTGDLFYKLKYGEAPIEVNGVSPSTVERATTIGVSWRKYVKIVKELEK